MAQSRSSISILLFIAVALVVAAVAPVLTRSDNQLVVYCAHDQVLAAGVIERFEQESGIQVDVRYDEEANKSLGLTQLLITEKNAPRADVFWNNQLMGTVRLKSEGILQPYRGFGWERIPEGFRDAEGYWTGFAARSRVFIINTDRMPATVAAVSERLNAVSLKKVAIAEPLFGTTLSHYCVLADQLGFSELQQWHRDLRERGIRVVRGNSMVKDMVVEGICDMGFTDTDDAFAAIDAGAPIEIFPVRLSDERTICLPNSVAMIAGCRHPESARRFIEFLLSEETEQQLADGTGRQIPLGPVDETQLNDDILRLTDWAANAVPLATAATHHAAVQQWLTAESTGR